MPPIRIDPTNPTAPVFLNHPNQYWGPWQLSGALYLMARVSTSATVYKSTDSGLTWTEQDVSNKPAFSGSQAASAFLVSTDIRIAWASASGIQIVDFDTSTDTYGTPTAAATSSTSSCHYVYLAQLSTGNDRIYDLDGPGTELMFWSEYSGTWTARTLVSSNLAGDAAAQPQMLLGSNDVMHLWWGNNAGLKNLYYRQLAADGSLGSIQTLVTGSTVYIFTGRAVIWNGKIVLPYVRQAGAFDFRPAVLYGNPETAPVWTSEDIDASQPDADNTFAWVDGSTLYVWYLVEDNSTIHRIYYASNDGSGWSSPTLFYDEASDPILPVPPFGQFVHNLSFTLFAGGTWGGFFGFEIGDGVGGQICTIFYSGQEEITLECVADRTKNPADAIDLIINWAGWLGTDQIATSSWSSTGLAIGATSSTATTATARISGGVAGTDYVVRNTISTQGGRTDTRSVRIKARECSGGATATDAEGWRVGV